MHVTEVLILGYEDSKPVCAINLEADVARVALTHPDDIGETVIDAAWRQSTAAFDEVREVVRKLAITPVG